jgi:hypothetical protein
MRLDRLQVELRPRSPWEAMELGSALLRRDAGRVWCAWLLASLPVFALCNALAWAFDVMWVATLAMWWLKPAFDRIPLFVVSRAVFGQAAGVRESAWAPWRFGRSALLRDLTWGRIGLSRALVLPVALLEGVSGATLRERRKVLAGQGGQSVVWLTLLCLHFEGLLSLAVLATVPIFIPTEYLSESTRALWSLMFESPPRWAQLLLNLMAWAATSLVEPFYIGAGFGLYLNRRTQLEGWDIEIAFRRLRARLRAAAAVAATLVALCIVLPLPARAQDSGQAPPAATAPGVHKQQPSDAPPTDRSGKQRPAAATRQSVFGTAAADPQRFQRAAEGAYRDPLLRPTRKQSTWVPKSQDDPEAKNSFSLRWLGALAGLFSETVLWIGLGLLVLWLLWRLPRWWPELWRPLPRDPPAPPAVQETAAPHLDALPHDIAAAARRLWSAGRPRAALALLYRASVEAMAARTDATLPPGATEAECLRASRRLRDAEDRGVFAEVVRTWQLAAYAQRLPDQAGFEGLLARGAQRFGWAA